MLFIGLFISNVKNKKKRRHSIQEKSGNRGKGRKNRQDYLGKKSKITDLNPIISLIALNANGLKH